MDEEISPDPPVIAPPLWPADFQPPAEQLQARPWGIWPTLGFGLAIVGGALAAQAFVVSAYAIWLTATRQNFKFTPDVVHENGLILSLSSLAAAPLVVGLSLWFASLRKELRARDYLGLHWPGKLAVFCWCGVFMTFVFMGEFAVGALKDPTSPDVMLEYYHHAGSVPLFWLAVVVIGPVSEEFFFRGFLFTGLQYSRLGALGAIILTSAVWAAIHVQYDFPGVAFIFFVGILLGSARWKTGSLFLCILLHSMLNLLAMIGMAVLLHSKN